MNSVRTVQRLSLLTCLGVLLAGLAGCGGGSAKGTVSGKVTYKGAPLTGGTIRLIPEGNGNLTAITLKADGTFSGDAPVGKMKVAFETDSVSAPMAYVMPKDSPPPPQTLPTAGDTGFKKVPIPAKYNSPDTSGFTWDIKAGTNDPKTFDLTD